MLEGQIPRCWVQADRAALDNILSDDWKVIDIAGQVRGKADIFRDMLGPKRSQTNDVTIDDVAVRLIGEVAVITSVPRRSVRRDDRDTPIDGGRIRRDGRWQVAAMQGTPMVE